MQNSEFNLSPLSDALGFEMMDMSIEDVLTPYISEQIYAAPLQHHLILFNNIDLSPALQVEFPKIFWECSGARKEPAPRIWPPRNLPVNEFGRGRKTLWQASR